jgi:uncharacterized membrane protein YeaQ/YmgE (transglycosylase-associated protein family)
MTIYAYALIGLIVGILARVALPSTRLVGFWGSVLLGALGGVIGALVASVFVPGGVTDNLHPVGIVLAIVVSALVSIGVTVYTRNKRFA